MKLFGNATFLLLAFVISASGQDKSVYESYLDNNVLDFIYKSRPMIELNYGLGSPKHNNLGLGFSDVGSWDLKLGKSEIKNYEGISVDLSERYLFFSYMSSSAQNYSSIEDEISTDTYRFGFGSRDGIGYGGSFLSVVPYVSQSFVWTKLSSYELPDNVRMPYESISELNDYLETFRFGDKSSYGIKAELASTFQFNAFYETSVVYRRHLFWYWSGSFIVSQVGYNILSHFTDEIVEASPVLGPIFNFALKAGYLYGYYLLRKDNMNWPFNPNGNEVPLTFETVNIGFSFAF